MKIAKFVVPERLLVQALNLPEGTRILAIQSIDRPDRNEYQITIGNDQLRDLIGYQAIPIIAPVQIKKIEPCGHISEINTFDWGYWGIPEDDED